MNIPLKTITDSLEDWAPLIYQESYDNSRLIFGDPDVTVGKLLISLDLTEKIIDEAIAKGVAMVVSHHPIVFTGLKSLTGKNDAERALIKAIRNNIAIYALHTNLDNISSGVNFEIGRKLGIKQSKVLAPKKGLLNKLVVYVPEVSYLGLSEAMWQAGAGAIGNYDQCSFRSLGKGTFRANKEANPRIGKRGSRHEEQEYRLEVLVESHCENEVIKAMKQAHPYEEVAYELYKVENQHQNIGSGMYGDLEERVNAHDFLKHIKKEFDGIVRYTKIHQDSIRRIAWCGGSGSFLLNKAKSVGADLFLSSDFKYHQFFEADNEILIADIGHFENEQFTIDLIAEHLRKKFPNFAVLLTENSTNPINYI